MLAATLAAIGFLVIGAFQGALALGAPLGCAAWGGANAVLPQRLRVSSAIAAVIWLAGAVVILGRGGVLAVPLPRDVLVWGSWVLVVLAAFGAVVNVASSSRWERFGWAPLAAVVAILAAVVASSPS